MKVKVPYWGEVMTLELKDTDGLFENGYFAYLRHLSTQKYLVSFWTRKKYTDHMNYIFEGLEWKLD